MRNCSSLSLRATGTSELSRDGVNFTDTAIRALVDIEPHLTTWNYFIGMDPGRDRHGCSVARPLTRLGAPVLTQAQFPDDLDTTSLGLTILNRPPHVAHLVMDKMLRYRTPDGLMQVRNGSMEKG